MKWREPGADRPQVAGGESIAVTLRVGMAAHASDLESLLRGADEAMSVSERGGESGTRLSAAKAG